jgi:DNA-directed RNA polymerase specialized sigma24 family protein
MSNPKAPTTLDHRLYAWLAEPHPQRFERAFSAYFAVAFPAVMRHLVRLSRWDPGQLEELAQDALLRFFEKVGKGRREASELVRTALQAIRPLNMGPFHERQVRSWAQDAESFRATAMSFKLAADEEEGNTDFKEPIRRLADRIAPLQARGSHLLDSVYVDLQWECASSRQAETTHTESEHRPARAIDMIEFAASFAAAAAQDSPRVHAAEQLRPGVTRFVAGTATVLNTLPNLRVPTNGYLFEMTLTIYLDECKKRGRQKRGGSGFLDAGERTGDVSHPLEQLGTDFEGPPDPPELDGEGPRPSATGLASDSSREPSVDPMRQFEDQEFFEKFHDFLRHPLDAATAEYERARLSGRATAELKKVESVSNKFARTVAVLTLMGEGYTQEQAAERLDLSRNQVKYIIELVQEAFERFSQTSDRLESHLASEGVRLHD